MLHLNGWLTAMISHDALGSVLEPRQTQHLICFAFLAKMIANCDFDSVEQILVETLAYHYALVGQRTNGFSNFRDYYISILLLVFMVNNFLHTGATWIRYHEQHDLF